MTDSLATSAPSVGKSWVQQFFERARGVAAGHASAPAETGILKAGAQTLGSMLEGGATSALLGAAHAKFGLDSEAGPIDGWIAGLGALGAVAASKLAPGLVPHAIRVSQAAFDVLAFRKSFELVHHAPLGGVGVSLQSGVQRVSAPPAISPHAGAPVNPLRAQGDPIEAAAKGLK